LASNEAKTGSFATTGSNYFIGTQVITGSVYIANDLIVQGSSSLQNITASAVSIGTNTVILNTASPAVRFAGISVRDSGSNSSVTSSIWYDSLNNKWIYQNESGSSYSGGMFISGPRNTGSLGSEAGMDNGYITKGLGGDHIGPSIIFESGSTNIGIGTNVPAYKLEVSGGIGAIGITTSGDTLVNGVSYLGGNNALQSTDKPHFFRFSGGGLGISSNNEGSGNQPIYMYTAGTVRLAISGSGNIGFGTTSPLARLHTYAPNDRAAIRIQNTAANKVWEILPAVNNVSNTGLSIFNVTDATTPLHIMDGGNVGIGTTNPSTKLHVISNEDSNWSATISNTGTNGHNMYFGYNNGSTTYGVYISGGSNNGSSLVVANQFYVNNNGRVGIGTDNPSYTLHVSKADNSFFIGSSTRNGYFVPQANGTTNISYFAMRFDDNAIADSIRLYNNFEGAGYGQGVAMYGAGDKVMGSLQITQTDTSNTAAKFTLNLRNSDASSAKVTVLGNGSVGIGTTSPISNLQVFATNGNGIAIGQNSASTQLSANLFLYPSDNTSSKRNWAITTYYDRPELLQFRRSSTTTSNPYDSGVTLITLDGVNDRVGIGTISPDAVLAVHGQFKIKTTNGDGNENRLFFNPGGASDPAQLYLYNEAQSNTIYITANGTSSFNGGNVSVASLLYADRISLTNFPTLYGTKVVKADAVTSASFVLTTMFPEMSSNFSGGNVVGVIGKYTLFRSGAVEAGMFSISRNSGGTWSSPVYSTQSATSTLSISSITGSSSTITLNFNTTVYVMIEITAMIE
jgi:hypothetical protein